MAKLLATDISCLLFSACAGTSWRATAPHNAPAASGYNYKLKGWYALRDGWTRLRAPRGFEWCDLPQSYRETLR